MQKTIISLILTLLLGLHASVSAMTLERVNQDLFATGPTVDEDFLKFKEAFSKEGIERLILVNGTGGDLWTGMRVARMVQVAKIKTVTSGFCMSACSLIFIAGQQRAFGTGYLPRATMVGIHGASTKDTKKVLTEAMPQMYALYKQQMGDKFDAPVISQALYDIKEAYGFLRIREIQRNQEKDRTPWFCPTSQTPLMECQQHTGKDAYSLGVVTQTETEILALPTSMQTRLGFYGRPLTPPTTDPQGHAEKLLEIICADNALCKSKAERDIQNYASSSIHKSVAVGWGGQGYGIRVGDDDPSMAMHRALYSCNHRTNTPKLCRLVTVNDHELLPLYEEAHNQTSTLLQGLKMPDAARVQVERDEPGSSTPSKLLYGNHITGMTPKALEGIRRVDSAELATALLQNTRPVLIDVTGAGPSIPGALNFLHAGLAFTDEKREVAYEERFRQMLQAAAPDPNQPVAFYCSGSECWLSVNAAMRARKIGYTQVMWYRGGITAWVRLGLPTVQRTPVAILN